MYSVYRVLKNPPVGSISNLGQSFHLSLCTLDVYFSCFVLRVVNFFEVSFEYAVCCVRIVVLDFLNPLATYILC